MDQMLDIQIVRAIAAIGPLERKQIINRVNAEKLDVEASLDALVTMGCLRAELNAAKQFVYKLKPNFTERDCKSVDHRQRVCSYVSRHGSKSKEVLPVTQGIKFSDGIDRAIWKAANTGRWMMVREIRDILMSVGFPKMEVMNRIQSLINSGEWFNRQTGHRRNQFFMLKDTVECPPIPGESRVMVMDDKGVTTISSTSNAIIPTVNDSPQPGEYFPLSSLDAGALQAAHDAAKLLIKPEGTLHEAIWAILQDEEEYSYADLVTLLEPFGFTDNQISPVLSKRYTDGLLARRLVHRGGKWYYVYKKAGELPAKFTSQGSVVSAIVEAQGKTEASVIVSVQESDHSFVPREDSKIFEFNIKIKGCGFSLSEFSTLYKELRDAGFGGNPYREKAPENRMLKTNHYIRGMLFTREELDSLATEMHSLKSLLAV